MEDLLTTVCITVTHDLRRDELPLLRDECLDLVGTSPEFLYGIQGRTARHAITMSDLRLGNQKAQTFATLTLKIPHDPEAPLHGGSNSTFRVADCKRMKVATRNALLEMYVGILHRYHDSEEIAAVIGHDAPGEDVIHRLTVLYPVHLPELMRVAGLDLGIFKMRSAGGRVTTIAMIDRHMVQTYVTAIESDLGGQAFSYRLADRDGNPLDIALPRRTRRSIAYEPTKQRYQTRSASVCMTITTRASEPGNVVEADVMCGGGVGPGEAWAVGVLHHQEAHEEATNSSIAAAVHDHPLRRGKVTKTKLTLINPDEIWPDCSRDNRLHTSRFIDPNNASAPTLRALISLIEAVIDLYDYPDRIRPVHKDPRKVLEALVLEYPQHAFDALEQTNIEVAVLPTRWPDGSVSLVTAVRKQSIQKYLRSAVTIGITGPVRYVINYDDEDASPTWIELNPTRASRRRVTLHTSGLTRSGGAIRPQAGLAP